MSEIEKYLGPVTLRLNTLWILNPNYPGLIHTFRQRGYRPSREVGVLAEKGNFRVVFDPRRRVLGVAGDSSNAVVTGFKEMIEILENDIRVHLGNAIIFYELLGGLQVLADHSPLDKLNNAFRRVKIFRKFKEVMGEDVALFSMRLRPRERRPDDLEWFSITIAPVVTSPDSRYDIEIVYRSVNKDKVLTFLYELENKVIDLTKVVGGT